MEKGLTEEEWRDRRTDGQTNGLSGKERRREGKDGARGTESWKEGRWVVGTKGWGRPSGRTGTG